MTTPNLPQPATFKAWADAVSATIAAIKTVIGLMPSGKNREEAERLLAEAETEHKHAEAALAQKLGFELCEYCWPPEIVLVSPESQRLECRHCHRPPQRIERDEKFWKVAQSGLLNHDA